MADGEHNGLKGFEQLGKFLDEDGRHPIRDEVALAYNVNCKGSNVQFGCYILVRAELEQLLCYAVAPIDIPSELLPVVLEFIARANHGMRIGNFEISFTTQVVRYKSSVDFEGIELSAQLIKNTLYPAVRLLDRYWPGLVAIVDEGASAADAVALVENES